MRILSRTLGVALLAVPMLAEVATAHDHRPPDAVLTSGRVEQEGRLVTSCWIRGKELGGAALCRRREMSFPESVEARREITVGFDTAAQPVRVRVRAWRSLRANGRPKRPARRLDAALEETPEGWAARFALPPRPGTWYLELKGVWADARFPDSKQFAIWTFAAAG